MVPVDEAEDVIQETGDGSLSDCVGFLFQLCACVYVTIIAWYFSVLLVHKQCNTFWGCPFTLCILNTAGACDIVI